MSAEPRWGIYPWFPDGGTHWVHPEDLAMLTALQPYGRLVEHLGAQAEYLVLRYGTVTFRVAPDLFRPVAASPIPIGSAVALRSDAKRIGTVAEMYWHSKLQQPFYLLRFGSQPASKRYFEDDLIKGLGSRA